MLTAGKISIEEAEMLLDALGYRRKEPTNQQESQGQGSKSFLGDFDFGAIFDDFSDRFCDLNDIFGGAAKQKNCQSTRR